MSVNLNNINLSKQIISQQKHLSAVVILTMTLSACGGDNTGLLNVQEQVTPQQKLLAQPSALLLTVDELTTVNVAPLVQENGISGWALSEMPTDSAGLGLVSNLQSTQFDYLPQGTGVTALNYTISGEGHSSSSDILVAISAPSNEHNNAPVAQNINVSVKNNATREIDLSGFISDSDNDPLTLTKLSGNTERFSQGTGNVVNYRANGFIGIDTAAYSIEDGQGGYAVGYIVVTSEDANPPTPNRQPSAKDFAQTLDTATTSSWLLDTVALDLIADADGDALSLVHVYASNGRVTIEDKTKLRYTPGDFVGVDQFTYIVSDGKGGFAAATVTMTVNRTVAENRIPTASLVTVPNVLDNATSPRVISLVDAVADADDDALTLVYVGGSVGKASINPAMPLSVNYLPSGAKGKDSFVYVVTDGKGGYAMSSIDITLTASNEAAPTTRIAKFNVTHNDPTFRINLDDYASDSQTPTSQLTYSNVSSIGLPSGIGLSGERREFIDITPNGYIGTQTLSYEVSDGELSSTGYIVIVIRGDTGHTFEAGDFSLPPIEVSNPTTAVAVPWQAHVTSSAIDGNEYTLHSVIGGSRGTPSITPDGQLTYTPTLGEFGTDSFVYTVRDSHSPAHYAQGVVSVTLTPPPAPEITGLSVNGIPEAGLPVGKELTANVVCAACDMSKTQYEWKVNGVTVSTAPTYTYRAEDTAYNLRLTVTGQDAFGQITAEHNVYNAMSSTVAMIGQIAKTTEVPDSYSVLQKDGTVFAWGMVNGKHATKTFDVLSSGAEIIKLVSNSHYLAALKSDNSAIMITSNVYSEPRVVFEETNVNDILLSNNGMTFLKNDGSFVSDGDPGFRSNSTVDDSPFVKVVSTKLGALGLKADRSAYSWGRSGFGPEFSYLNVKNIFSNDASYVLLHMDNSVKTAGEANSGGNSNSVIAQMRSGVVEIYHSTGAFAALKENGSVITWGKSLHGGNSSGVRELLQSGVVKIYDGGGVGFAALKNDGSLVVWGDGIEAQVTTGVKDVVINKNNIVVMKKDGKLEFFGSKVYASTNVTAEDQYINVYGNSYFGQHIIAEAQDGSFVIWSNSPTENLNSIHQSMLSGVVDINFLGSGFLVRTSDGRIFGTVIEEESLAYKILNPKVVLLSSSIEPI